MYVPLSNPRSENIEHRKAFLEKLGLGGKQVAMAQLVHGAQVAVINRRSPYIVPETDALITKDSDIILTLTGADCFPVYFEEKQAGIIGLAHCGWRGIVTDILPKTIAAIEKAGGKPPDLTVTIGPGICAKHFEIQADTLPSFAKYSVFVSHDNGLHVDLRGILRHQATHLGVFSDKILDSGECTYCFPNKYFSCRRDKPAYLENHLAYVVQFSHRKFS